MFFYKHGRHAGTRDGAIVTSWRWLKNRKEKKLTIMDSAYSCGVRLGGGAPVISSFCAARLSRSTRPARWKIIVIDRIHEERKKIIILTTIIKQRNLLTDGDDIAQRERERERDVNIINIRHTYVR